MKEEQVPWQVEIIKERIELIEVHAFTADAALTKAGKIPGVVRVNKIIHRGKIKHEFDRNKRTGI